MRLSSKACGVAQSATLRLAVELARLRRAGKEVISLLEGESDLPIPPQVKAATALALRRGSTRYSNPSGLQELKNLIARKLRHDNGIDTNEQNILVTNGAKQAVYCALQALCNPGDEVIVPAPYWVTFPESVRLAGARPIFVYSLGQHLDVEAIAKAITRKTKAIILNTPNNPTGAVYTEDQLRAIGTLACRHNLMILADEAYEDLVYDGCRHVSIASVSNRIAKRTITIQTFSKTYSMTGLRVGYMAADPALISAAARIHGHMTGNVCTIVQHGAIAALTLKSDFHERQRARFQKRRDLAFAETVGIFDCLKPRGGYFLFPDVSRHLGRRHKNSAALAEYLLKQALVATLPGSACGMEGHLRISFSGSEETVVKGFKRIKEALSQ